MDKDSDSEYYTPSSEPFAIIHCHQHLDILDGTDAHSVLTVRKHFIKKNLPQIFPSLCVALTAYDVDRGCQYSLGIRP
jgi:hypothetical protein